jgi:hypothetical protein
MSRLDTTGLGLTFIDTTEAIMKSFKEHDAAEKAKEKAFYVPSSPVVKSIHAELEMNGQVVSVGSYKKIRVMQLIHGGTMYKVEMA